MTEQQKCSQCYCDSCGPMEDLMGSFVSLSFLMNYYRNYFLFFTEEVFSVPHFEQLAFEMSTAGWIKLLLSISVTHMCTWATEAWRGHCVPGNWNRLLWATVRVLGTKPGSFVRAVSALDCWANFPASSLFCCVLFCLEMWSYSVAQAGLDRLPHTLDIPPVSAFTGLLHELPTIAVNLPPLNQIW